MGTRWSAPGNVFFFGEHATVYDQPAIVASVDRRTHVSVYERDDDLISVESEGYGENSILLDDLSDLDSFETGYVDALDPALDLVRRYDQEHGILTGLDIVIESEIPRETGGMSSSTAFLTAMLTALDDAEGGVLEEPVDSFCYPVQEQIHGGSASGTEFASSIDGGYHVARPGEDGLIYEPIDGPERPIVIGDTGVEAPTGETVPYVRDGWEAEPGSYEHRFEMIQDIVETGAGELADGNIDEVGRLMNENQKHLRALGVTGPGLEDMIEAVEGIAAGAKLSGGGKHGIMIALPGEDAEEEDIDAIEALLSKAGERSYSTVMGVEGVRRESL